MQKELIASVWTAVAVPVENEEEKKERKPKLKDDRMNQPDGVSRFDLCIFLCFLYVSVWTASRLISTHFPS